jgi:transcription antitermination factor NusG
MTRRNHRIGETRIDLPPSCVLRWRIAVVEPGCDSATGLRLSNLGLSPYMPTEWRGVSAGRGRKREIEVPMLPGYLMVPLPDLFSAWQAVRHTRGVAHLLHCAGSEEPALVRDEAIDLVRAIERERNNKRLKRLAAAGRGEWQKGDEAWVDLLPNRALLAKVSGYDARGLIEVLLDEEVFGRKIWAVQPKQLLKAG